MARNGSGTMTPSVDFTTEAASPPIEIAKLDTVLDDVAAEITNSIAADGQTNPSANLPMNGFRHTNVGAATALTHYARVSELIDQDHIYYVDSGAADAYVITPSPAIAAYEEGQRFVVRITNASTGASTLNVNGLGAIAIQTPDGSALIAGSLAAGGIYEFTYDANTSPDRWVLTSPPSNLPFTIAASDFARKSQANTFTADQTIRRTDTAAGYVVNFNDAVQGYLYASDGAVAILMGSASAHPVQLMTNNTARLTISSGGAFDFHSGAVLAATIANSDSETLVAGQQHFIDANATLPNLAAGQWIQVINDSGSSITISKNGSDTTYWTATGATVSTSFTLAARGVLTARCNPAGSAVYVSGSGITAAT